jgi:hypothetical protein
MQMLANVFGCDVGSLPFAYLGLPLSFSVTDHFFLTPCDGTHIAILSKLLPLIAKRNSFGPLWVSLGTGKAWSWKTAQDGHLKSPTAW